MRAFTWKTDNDLAMITGRSLAQYLDDRFVLIRNVSKRQIGYVDAVLVGPPGTLVFRILDAEGNFANEGANWLRIKPNGESVPGGINPTREAIADIRKVREYLDKHHVVNTPVYGVVVFTKDEQRVRLSARDPVVPPSHLRTLVNNLRPNYLAKDRIDQADGARDSPPAHGRVRAMQLLLARVGEGKTREVQNRLLRPQAPRAAGEGLGAALDRSPDRRLPPALHGQRAGLLQRRILQLLQPLPSSAGARRAAAALCWTIPLAYG